MIRRLRHKNRPMRSVDVEAFEEDVQECVLLRIACMLHVAQWNYSSATSGSYLINQVRPGISEGNRLLYGMVLSEESTSHR